MRYECLDCQHQFNELGKTYADLDLGCTNAIGACPQCLSDDYVDFDEEIAPIPKVEMPVELKEWEDA